MINTNKIKGRMREKELSQAQAARIMGISPCTLNLKINNARATTLDEAEKLCKLLDIADEEFVHYFFA